MYFDTLNNEQQVSYLIKPIIEVLQEAGGQLERSEIELVKKMSISLNLNRKFIHLVSLVINTRDLILNLILH